MSAVAVTLEQLGPAGRRMPIRLAPHPHAGRPPGVEPETSAEVRQIRLVDLEPAPDNPRESMGKLDELIVSMRAVGILQPLVVVRQRDTGRYTIVCGERRWAAAHEAGLTTVPCLVRELTETERVEAMLVENLQRSSLSRLEEAHAFEQLMRLGHTQGEIARRVGKSQSYVCRRLLLLSLPVAIRDRVERGELPVDQALGYETAPPAGDMFRSDEALERSWIDLRTEILGTGDRRLIQLLREFAQAFTRHSQVVQQSARAKAASRKRYSPRGGPARRAAPVAVLIRSE